MIFQYCREKQCRRIQIINFKDSYNAYSVFKNQIYSLNKNKGCTVYIGNLKGQCHNIVYHFNLLLKDSTWALCEQGKTVSRTFLFSRFDHTVRGSKIKGQSHDIFTNQLLLRNISHHDLGPGLALFRIFNMALILIACSTVPTFFIRYP